MGGPRWCLLVMAILSVGCAVDSAVPAGDRSSTIVGVGGDVPTSLPPPETTRGTPGPERTGVAEIDALAEQLGVALRARGHSDAFARCYRNELAGRLHGPELTTVIALLTARDSSPDDVQALIRDSGVEAGRLAELPSRIAAIEDLCRSFDVSN